MVQIKELKERKKIFQSKAKNHKAKGKKFGAKKKEHPAWQVVDPNEGKPLKKMITVTRYLGIGALSTMHWDIINHRKCKQRQAKG